MSLLSRSGGDGNQFTKPARLGVQVSFRATEFGALLVLLHAIIDSHAHRLFARSVVSVCLVEGVLLCLRDG